MIGKESALTAEERRVNIQAKGEASVDTRWFQNRLADLRLPQRKLASLLNLDPSAVSLMLRGRRKATSQEVAEIAKLLGVSGDEVLWRLGSAPTMPVLRSEVKTDVQGRIALNPKEIASPAPVLDAPAVSVAGQAVPDALELPVPLADGTVAMLRLPRVLKKADAARIAALVTAFASQE